MEESQNILVKVNYHRFDAAVDLVFCVEFVRQELINQDKSGKFNPAINQIQLNQLLAL